MRVPFRFPSQPGRGSHCRREDIWMVDEIITAYYQLDSEFGYDFVYNLYII